MIGIGKFINNNKRFICNVFLNTDQNSLSVKSNLKLLIVHAAEENAFTTLRVLFASLNASNTPTIGKKEKHNKNIRLSDAITES